MSWKLPTGTVVPVFQATPPFSQRHFDELRAHALCARLCAVGAAVPAGARVVDVGTDHGALPLALARAGLVGAAWGVDASPPALARARGSNAWLTGHALAELVDGDGPAAVRAAFDCVTFAGLGGELIASLVQRDELVERGVTRLVVQPNTDERLLRRALGPLGWRIVGERLVVDERRMFLTMVAEPGEGSVHDDTDTIVGPCLRHGDPLLGAWLQTQRAWVQAKRDGRRRAGDDEGAAGAEAHLRVLDAVQAR